MRVRREKKPRTVPVSEFKAHCLQLVEEAAAGHSIIVTKRGRPLALLTALPPATEEPTRGRWKGRIEVRGEIEHVDWSEDFDACR